MPTVGKAVEVVKTEHLSINEFFGGVSTPSLNAPLSAALETVELPKGKDKVVNPWQTNAFDEYVLVLEGTFHIFYGKDVIDVMEVSPSSSRAVLLPKDTPLQWVFSENCKFVTICNPAFRPDRVGVTENPTTAAVDGAPAACAFKPVDVVQATDLTITEFFGNVASADPKMSACVARVREPCVEAYQAPDFDEYVLVLEGQVNIRKQQKGEETSTVHEVKAGESIFLAGGERVRWEWPQPCVYVPICTPAFSPMNCHREEDAGAAKDVECMKKLEALHEGPKDADLIAGA